MAYQHASEASAAPHGARLRARVGLELPLRIAAAAAVGFVLGLRVAGYQSLVAIALVVAAGLVLCVVLQRWAMRPLSTAATILDALRHGDYAHRARLDSVRGSSAALLLEVNELADHLERERLRRQETQALLSALIERVDVALLAFDADERLVWWNPAAAALLGGRLKNGAPAASLGARDLLSGPSERSVSLDGVGLDGGSTDEPFELRRGLFHQGGERYHFVLLSSAQRLRRQEERAAWQRLVRVLGHEVNSTLTPIQSLAGTCLALLDDQQRTREASAVSPESAARSEAATSVSAKLERALQTIEHRARGLGQFIADYARLARLPEPRVERVELNACLQRLVALDERCALKLVPQSPVEVLVDPVLLDQALTNLLRNAIDASVEKGGDVRVDFHANEREVVLTITDEGAGIQNLDNLFVPLFSTKAGGSGVGLVLARNIIEAHGGQLRLSNRSDARGAVARLTLPRAPK